MGKEGRGETRRLGDLIAQLMKTAIKPRRGEMEELCAAWCRAVGADMARHSRPVGFRNGQLRVSFDSPTLRHEIESFRKTEILARVRAECPERTISGLKCVLAAEVRGR